MKKNITLVLLCVFAFTSCKKNDSTADTNVTNSNYYFNCEVDGKKINLPFSPKTLNDLVGINGISMGGYVANTIMGGAGSTQCSTAGSYCTTCQFEIAAQKAGVYKTTSFAYGFFFSLTEGADTYNYYSTDGSLTITIDKIVHSTVTNPTLINQLGIMTGSFNGIVKKTKLTGNTGTFLPSTSITGSFSFPLQ